MWSRGLGWVEAGPGQVGLGQEAGGQGASTSFQSSRAFLQHLRFTCLCGLSRGEGGSGMGRGGQSSPWGPHRVTPRGKEIALSSGRSQAGAVSKQGKGVLRLGVLP